MNLRSNSHCLLFFQKIQRAFDTDGNGFVDHKEFLCALAAFRSRDVDAAKLYFSIFDADNRYRILFIII